MSYWKAPLPSHTFSTSSGLDAEIWKHVFEKLKSENAGIAGLSLDALEERTIRAYPEYAALIAKDVADAHDNHLGETLRREVDLLQAAALLADARHYLAEMQEQQKYAYIQEALVLAEQALFRADAAGQYLSEHYQERYFVLPEEADEMVTRLYETGLKELHALCTHNTPPHKPPPPSPKVSESAVNGTAAQSPTSKPRSAA